MNGTRSSMGWGARLVTAFTLVLVGAAAAVWSLGHYHSAAELLGVPSPAAPMTPRTVPLAPKAPVAGQPQGDERISLLEQRLARVEDASQRAEGSAGRADALVIAFAARRAIDRGVALGYLEALLKERFGPQHPAAVATIITMSHQPVRLNELIDEYEGLGPVLRRGASGENWWAAFKRELGSIAEVHRADQPPVNPEARYSRALQHLQTGDVDRALAETMRMPGAAGAAEWTTKARHYVGAHRALDEIESAALMPAPQGM